MSLFRAISHPSGISLAVQAKEECSARLFSRQMNILPPEQRGAEFLLHRFPPGDGIQKSVRIPVRPELAVLTIRQTVCTTLIAPIIRAETCFSDCELSAVNPWG